MNAIIVGIDANPESYVAARQAVRMANAQELPLHLVTVVRHTFTGTVQKGTDEWFLDSFNVAEHMLLALGHELAPKAGYSTAVIKQRPAKALCAEARRVGASLIVLGCAGSTAGLTRNTVLQKVRRKAPCEVLAFARSRDGAVTASRGVGEADELPGLRAGHGHLLSMFRRDVTSTRASSSSAHRR